MANQKIENPNYRPIIITAAGGTAAGVTLQNAYDAGAPATHQIITLSAANGGIVVDAAGHLSGLDGVNNIFNAIDSTVLDPTGTPCGIRVTRLGELLGSFETSVRQRIMLWGGNTTTPIDVAIRITSAVSAALPAGILILGAQDAVPGSTQSGGPVYIVNGLGGGLVGGFNGPIILGQAGIENSGGADDAHAPYVYIDGGPNAGNPTSGSGISLRSKPGSTNAPAVNISSVTRYVAGSTAPMVRFYEGVFGGAGRNLVEIWGDPTQTMIVYGSYASGIGPLIVRDDASDSGNVGTGITLDARTAGGHQWDILSRGTGAAGLAGAMSFYDASVGGQPGERLEILNDGTLQPGNHLAYNFGSTSRRWLTVFAQTYAGVSQINATGAGAVSINTNLGDAYVLTAIANITGLTFTGGLDGQQFTLILVQDPAGAFVWTTTITNAKLVGGAFAKSAGANKVDVLQFRCVGANVWYQVAPIAAAVA